MGSSLDVQLCGCGFMRYSSATVQLHIPHGRLTPMDEVEREIVVGAVREEVWSALTESERLAEWLGDEASIDLRPDGEVVVRAGDVERRGFVESVEAPALLVLWWREVDEDGEEGELTRVAFSLEPAEDGTRVRVVESRVFATLDARGIEVPSRPRHLPGRSSSEPTALAGLAGVR
jgi:uncharacterized protein YndB with AHSA1/START domain